MAIRNMNWCFSNSSCTSIWASGLSPGDDCRYKWECEHPLAILNGWEHDVLKDQLSECALLNAGQIYYDKLSRYLMAYGCNRDVLVDFRDNEQLKLPFEIEGEPKEVDYNFKLQQSFDFGESAFPLDWPPTFREGKLSRVLVNRHERSDKARTLCIQHYGVRCQYCGFKFEEKYGEVAQGVIQVHDMNPLANGNRETNAIRDLRPTCANCHIVLHLRRDSPYSEEEIKLMIRNAAEMHAGAIREDNE